MAVRGPEGALMLPADALGTICAGAVSQRESTKGIGLDLVSKHDRLTKEITQLRGERQIAQAIKKVLTPVVKKAAVPAWQMSDFDDFDDFLVGDEI